MKRAELRYVFKLCFTQAPSVPFFAPFCYVAELRLFRSFRLLCLVLLVGSHQLVEPGGVSEASGALLCFQTSGALPFGLGP